ncbi:MAG: YdcF family protein [Chitinophaga rupis]
MQHKCYLFLAVLGLVLIRPVLAQPGAGYQKEYKFLHSTNRVADKNFYLITVIDETPSVRTILAKEQHLLAIAEQRSAMLKLHATDSCSWPGSLLDSFRFSSGDSQEVTAALQALYKGHQPLFDKMINQHLRPSGYYQRFVAQSNEELLLNAWGQYVKGINYIIDQFGLGKKMRYPRIDSASYPVNSRYYRTALKDMFAYLGEKMELGPVFYTPSLAIALQLMDLNDRDEPARFEPMESGENKKAVLAIKTTNWSKFSYATILIPGNGPELTSTPISPINKMHCAIAAARYQKGWAPFIIVSGGYCYPFRGPYCEAIEMKKYLMEKFSIPETAILIDPFARHTTTNIRNADRLMIRYGIPLTRPSVFITTKSQTDYANDALFDLRNLHELGYLPYKGKKRISLHDIEFYPVLESLHMDPEDPLDP